MNPRHPKDRIARRLKWYREHRRLTQEQLAKSLGFKDRQILAAIELGERRISPAELVAAAKILNVELDEFLDPFRLVGEGQFSFRTNNDTPNTVVDAFADRVGCWIATYRELGCQAGLPQKTLGYKLELRPDSSFEDAQRSAQSLWKKWELGEVPAKRLYDAVTGELGVLVLYVDAPTTISGAASQLPGLPTIVVNRRESQGRRNYDLAHELFHILTWDAMPPDRVERQETKPTKGNRVEQLANNFAAALLMPEPIMTARWERRGDLDIGNWVVVTANALKVSASALQWRLVNLKMISKRLVIRFVTEQSDRPESVPMLFSSVFIYRVYDAVESGRLSLRRAAVLLELSLDSFMELCRNYGRQLSYDVSVQA